MLIVSQDSDFLDCTVTLTIGLDGSGMVDMVVGGYADWETKRKGSEREEEGGAGRSGPLCEGSEQVSTG